MILFSTNFLLPRFFMRFLNAFFFTKESTRVGRWAAPRASTQCNPALDRKSDRRPEFDYFFKI